MCAVFAENIWMHGRALFSETLMRFAYHTELHTMFRNLVSFAMC